MSTQTQVITENAHLASARGAVNKEACMALYDHWASSYNKDLADASQNYVAPILTAQTAVQMINNAKAPVNVLDAGCGTGLVGQALSNLKDGAITVDGADLSLPMLKVAEETGVYRTLTQVDLTQPIDKSDGSYDVVTCCGTFTRGHVGPDPALREFVRLVKPGGFVVATVLHEIWLEWGFGTETEKLEKEGLASVVSTEVMDYRRGAGDKATFLVLKKASA
ncbi:S-adenosyl-L-methionine-dependent methyltransferase [Aspergillus falconensis]